MTARTDIAESVEAAERDIDRLFAPLAPSIRQSVERHAVNGTITHASRKAILRDLDALLDVVFPSTPEATSRLGTMILGHIETTALKPVAAEAERIALVLSDDPELLRRMRGSHI